MHKEYTIINRCIGCTTCLLVCKFGAIFQGAPFRIDRDKCIGCGDCASSCPVSAIVLDIENKVE